jgi:hypothetical protein
MNKFLFIPVFILFAFLMIISNFNCSQISNNKDTSQSTSSSSSKISLLGGWVYTNSTFNPIALDSIPDPDYKNRLHEFNSNASYIGLYDSVNNRFKWQYSCTTPPGFTFTVTDSNLAVLTETSTGAYINYNFTYFDNDHAFIYTTFGATAIPYKSYYTTCGFFNRITNYTNLGPY